MSNKYLTNCQKVKIIQIIEIYEKNIEIKSSAFQDGSDWGSVVDSSSIAPPNRETMKKAPKNIP